MKYGDAWVTTCYDSGILRTDPTTGKNMTCEGYFCQVYIDEELEYEVDNFCLAVGHEIDDLSDQEVDRGIREYLGLEPDMVSSQSM